MRETNKFDLSTVLLLALLSLISCNVKSSNIQPTLTPDDAYIELVKLFENNACQLPCWWGIEPGSTSISNAQSILSSYYQIAPSKAVKDGLILDLYIDVSTFKQEKNSKVNAMRVTERVFREIPDGYDRVYDEHTYKDLLGAYSLKSILDTLGHPENIFATAQIYTSESDAPDFLMIWLLYPDAGLIARYTANAELNDKEIVTSCPSESFFTFWLFDPDQYKNYKDLRNADPDLAYIFPNFPPQTKSISDAFGISDEDFYKMFTESEKNCIETPYNIWPGF